jgi:hypothetical protein
MDEQTYNATTPRHFGAPSSGATTTMDNGDDLNGGYSSYTTGKRCASAVDVAPSEPKSRRIEQSTRKTEEALQEALYASLTDTKIALDALVKSQHETKRLKDEAAQQQLSHDVTMNKMKSALNTLRYTMEFSVSPSRGVAICPISMDPISKNEIVLMMKSKCQCNCMVKYCNAGVPVNDFHDKKLVRCFKCNRSQVTKLTVSTAGQAEALYSWRILETMTGCDDINTVYRKMREAAEADVAASIAQTTAPLREQIEALKLQLEVAQLAAAK